MKFLRWKIALLFVVVMSVTAFAQENRVRTFDAQHYVIRTSFDRAAQTAFGETTVRLKPLAPKFKQFWLDAVDLQVESVLLESGGDKTLQFESAKERLNITLDKEYAPDDEIAVRVKYKVVKPELGLFFIKEQTKGNRPHSAQIWTQGEPEDNRRWFPSYDSPDDKATTEQFITTTAPDEIAVANGELVEVKTNPDDTKTFHYRMTVPHPTYLTSLIVGKFEQVADKFNNVPLTYNVYPGTKSIVPIAFAKTPKMMRVFGDKLKIEFPFNKYEQTVVADYTTFGAMENITATTIGDTEIYEAGQRQAETVVSHELAHSWFGDLVTCKNWANLWLNEGAATFFEAVFVENEYGRDQYLDEMRKNEMAYLEEEKVLKHPLLNPRARPNVLLFDSTTYKKGGFVLHLLRDTVGDELFWKSLTNYLNKHKYANVETADLQAAFEETTGQNLDWFFEQWVRKAGSPNLKITPTYNAATKKLTVKIEQTQKPDSQTPAVFRFTSAIEFDNKIEKIEMNRREQTFTFDAAKKPTEISFDPYEQVLKKVEIAKISAKR